MMDPGLSGAAARPVEGIDNGFRAGYRVRFDEAGPDGLVRTPALLRYAQDVAWRHSEDLGFDRAWYLERRRSWVVKAVDLQVVQPVTMGQTLRLSTAVIGHRRIWARRLAEARTAGDQLAAEIVTDWVLLDERGRLVRIPEDFGLSFSSPELGGEILKVAAAPSDDPTRTLGLIVRAPDLDPMDHVNNAVYLDWLEEALLAAGWPEAVRSTPRSARLEYLAAAGAGDDVEIELWLRDAGWHARIRRTSDGAELVRAEGERAARVG